MASTHRDRVSHWPEWPAPVSQTHYCHAAVPHCHQHLWVRLTTAMWQCGSASLSPAPVSQTHYCHAAVPHCHQHLWVRLTTAMRQCLTVTSTCESDSLLPCGSASLSPAPVSQTHYCHVAVPQSDQHLWGRLMACDMACDSASLWRDQHLWVRLTNGMWQCLTVTWPAPVSQTHQRHVTRPHCDRNSWYWPNSNSLLTCDNDSLWPPPVPLTRL